MKRLLVLLVLLFTMLFTCHVIAQEFGSVRGGCELKLPLKIQKLVLDPLPAGTYSIGSGGYFPTIDSAFNKLSIDGISGNVVLELTDELYSAPSDSFGFYLNGPISGSSPINRVTIKPAENKNVTIEGDGLIVMSFWNTSFVTIDGVNLTGTTTLTIHANQNTQYPWNDGIDFLDNSDNNIIQNTSIIDEDYTRGSDCIGIFTTTNTQSVPDGNLIQNNFLKRSGIAIYLSSYSSSSQSNNNIIRSNFIGSEDDSLISWGIQVEKNQNAIVEYNIVQNINGFNSAWDITHGINLYWCAGCIIRNNVVHNIKSGTTAKSTGILLSGGLNNTGSSNQLYNNIIYDIQSTSGSNSTVSGIRIWRQNNPKIYFNSVYLTKTVNEVNSTGSAALYIEGVCANIDVRNNILVNTRDESPACASSIRAYSGFTTLTSDYNDLYYEATPYNCLVRYGPDFHTLADWQATGKDLHSLTEMPNFIDPYLHIDETIPTHLEKRATPIAGIDTDFDGDIRNAYLPDIGADEFDGQIPAGVLAGGTYSVGTNGFFSSIETVFNKLNTDGIAGAVTFELIDNLYTAPTDSFGFKLNGPVPGAGPNSIVTIKPAENKNVVIEGDGRNTLSLWNTSYFTFDGVSTEGATTLTIHHLYNAAFDLNRGITFANNSDHNIVRNLILIGEDLYRYGDGINFLSSLNSTEATDSNLIELNFVKKGAGCVTIGAYFAAANVRPTGNIIRNNKFGSQTDSLYSWGIQLERCKNTIVENNVIQNQKVTLTYGSDIINVGINSFWGEGDIIRNNIVHNIKSTNGYTCTGILLSGGGGNYGNNNMVYNNMVFDIQSTSSQSSSRVAGIELWCQNNPMIYYNSVYLSGSGTNHQGSAAFYVYSGFGGSSGVEVKNNIFVNTRDESPYFASSIYTTNSSQLNSDYNDLYYDDTNINNCLVRIGSISYITLPDWQALGKDQHSYVEMPHFISSTDLHINETIPTYLESRGIPILGIESDIDDDARNTLTPDIGADEFSGIVGVEDEMILPTEFILEQNYPNPFNPSTKIKYSVPQTSQVQIKVYDVLGNEIETLVNEEKPTGSYEKTWNAANLPSGVYFYQLKAGSFIETKKMILIK